MKREGEGKEEGGKDIPSKEKSSLWRPDIKSLVLDLQQRYLIHNGAKYHLVTLKSLLITTSLYMTQLTATSLCLVQDIQNNVRL